MKVRSCTDADFLYGTQRFTANLTQQESEELYNHACICKREDWWHAILSDQWGSVERQRERNKKFEKLHTKLHTKE